MLRMIGTVKRGPKIVKHIRLLSTNSNEKDKSVKNFVLRKEGSITAKLSPELAKSYKKENASLHDLTIEVFNQFTREIYRERMERYEIKYEKFLCDNIEKPVLPCEGITVLATDNSISALRYMKETENLQKLIVNCEHPSQSLEFEENMKLNNLSPQQAVVLERPSRKVLYDILSRDVQVDVLELRPKSDVPAYLDAAVQVVAKDGGLLCITDEEIMGWMGASSPKCFARYGTVPAKGTVFVAELAIRTLLGAISDAASRYSLNIQPWLSFCVADSAHVFVRVSNSRKSFGNRVTMDTRVMLHVSKLYGSFYCSRLGDNNSIVGAFHPAVSSTSQQEQEQEGSSPHHAVTPVLFGATTSPEDEADLAALFGSDQQSSSSLSQSSSQSPSSQDDLRPVSLLELPEFTGIPADSWGHSGPYWGQAIHDQGVVDDLLFRFKGIQLSKLKGRRGGRKPPPSVYTSVDEQVRLLGIVSDEVKDGMFTYSLTSMCKILHAQIPTYLEVVAALSNAGYQVSNFHTDLTLVKTDAPSHVVWDILKAFVEYSNQQWKKPEPNSVAEAILNRPSTLKDVSFISSKAHRRRKKY